MNLKNYYLILLIAILITSCSQKSNNPLPDLKEQRIHSLSLYFYPSTIRMINLGKDSTFHSATKDIKRVQYVSVDLTEEKNDSIYQAWYAQQDFSVWDELFQASAQGSLTTIYAPKDVEDQYFAFIKTSDGVNLIWAEGKLDLNQAVNLMNSDLNLGPISSFLDNKVKEDQRREVWNKAREQAREEQKLLEKEDSIRKQEKVAL